MLPWLYGRDRQYPAKANNASLFASRGNSFCTWQSENLKINACCCLPAWAILTFYSFQSINLQPYLYQDVKQRNKCILGLSISNHWEVASFFFEIELIIRNVLKVEIQNGKAHATWTYSDDRYYVEILFLNYMQNMFYGLEIRLTLLKELCRLTVYLIWIMRENQVRESWSMIVLDGKYNTLTSKIIGIYFERFCQHYTVPHQNANIVWQCVKDS